VKGFFDFPNQDAVSITLIFRMECQPVLAFTDQSPDFLQTPIIRSHSMGSS
jgi:hypothetical protein